MRAIGIESTPILEGLGACVYVGLVDIGESPRYVNTYISIYESTYKLERMTVELTWWDNSEGEDGEVIGTCGELTEEEYDGILWIGEGSEQFEISIVSYCIQSILSMRRGEKETLDDNA